MNIFTALMLFTVIQRPRVRFSVYLCLAEDLGVMFRGVWEWGSTVTCGGKKKICIWILNLNNSRFGERLVGWWEAATTPGTNWIFSSIKRRLRLELSAGENIGHFGENLASLSHPDRFNRCWRSSLTVDMESEQEPLSSIKNLQGFFSNIKAL